MSIKFIRDLHQEIRDARYMRDVPRIAGKSYPRFPQIPLPPLTPIETTLSAALSVRRSADKMITATLPVNSVADILGHSLAVRKDGHRPHPSGGARYPLETYLIPFSVEGLSRHAYHYRPDTHVLERMWQLPEKLTPRDVFFDNEETCAKACAAIIFTAVWRRSFERYGTFSYQVGLMEAGHAGQNIALVATTLGIQTRTFAGFRESSIAPLLDLDAHEEQVVYLIALGRET